MSFMVLAVAAGGGWAAEGHGQHAGHETQAAEAKITLQTKCPVMEGNPIDQSVYVDHEGERVYFCCNTCVDAFTKEPGKYLDKLPQFANSADSVVSSGHDHGHEPAAQTRGLRLYRFTGPLGIATFSLLVLTLCTGLLRRKLKRRFLSIHKTLAFTTVTVATVHMLTVLLGH